MLPRSGDIRDQSLKWSKIDRNCACFWPPNFFGERPPRVFGEGLYNSARFRPCGNVSLRSVEGSRRTRGELRTKKDTSRVKHKPVRNSCSGRPNNDCGLERLEYKGYEDIAGERSENRHLRRPHSHLTPPFQQTPANIHIKLTLLETRIPVGLQFCR